MTDRATAPFSLRLFGPLDVRLSGEPLPRLRSRKGLWLLSLLALRHDAEVSRSWLAGLLWPDSSEAPALASLRNSLMDLRRAMGPEGHRLESPSPSTLRLRLEGAEADVVAFDAALSRGDAPSLDRAVSLYRGPLLEGCVEEWVLLERQMREQAYLGALEQLAADARERDEPGAAERYLRLAVAVDATRETAQRALMRLLADSGNYAGALQSYRNLRLHLHREFNAEPDPETRALFDQIRAEARGKAALGSRLSALGEDGGNTRAERRAPAVAEGGEPRAESREPRAGAKRLALLYRRGARPDEHVLRFLEEQLGARGYAIFVDRHLPVGVEWAREIEHQVRTADAVVPILSPSSVQSEMLAHEVQIAHEAARRSGGTPRLLPVRIGDTESLPSGPLAAILGPLVYAPWQGPEDDRRLVEQVLRALEEPPSPSPGPPRTRLEPAGGAVPLDSQFYVVRDTDHEFHEAIARGDSTVLIKGARQMGKTSLLGRGLDQARRAGARVLFTDFQQLNAAHLASAEAFYQTLGAAIADQLELDPSSDPVWDARLGPSMNFNRTMRREVLGRVSAPIVWGMDEVEQIAACPFGGEVFGLLRSWHNQRVTDPTAPWTRLTLAIAYATEAHLFITNLNQSPFNIGTRLTLADFTPEHVADLNARHGAPLRNQDELDRFYRLVGGQPYLVRRGLYEMSTRGVEIGLLEEQADREEGIFGDHLRRLLVVLARNPDLLEVMRGVLRGEPCPSADAYYRLRSAGILTGDTAAEARPRCPLYARYLTRHLLGTSK